MRPRRLALALLAGLTFLALLPARAPASMDFGVNATSVIWGEFVPRDRDRLLDRIATADIPNVRSDAWWYTDQPNSGDQFDWRTTDAVVTLLARRGLRWEPVMGETPVWQQSIRGNRHSPPKSNLAFGRWAAALARRYGAHGTLWATLPPSRRLPIRRYEIWNEPTHGYYWPPKGNPSRYAGLFLAASSAIHGVDPAAKVYVGGLTPGDPGGFVSRAVRSHPAMRTAVDGVALHPYGHDVLQITRVVRAFRQHLPALRMKKTPVAITELGWRNADGFTGAGDLPDPTRAGDLALAADAMRRSDCSVSGLDVFEWASREQFFGWKADWYGITAPEGWYRAPAKALIAALKRGRGGVGSRLPVCSGRATTRPLVVKLAVRTGPRTCRTARVTYAGYPLNGIALRGHDAANRGIAATTGANGYSRICRKPKRGRIRIQAVLDSWGRSTWVRR